MKKIFLFFFSLLFIVLSSYGQTQTSDTAREIKPCAATVQYCVEDMLLKAHLDQNLAKPEINPSFDGGVDELKKYFVLHSLTDEKAKDIVFRVHIGFTVNCKGEATNFQVVSKGKGYLQELAQQVLLVVKDMPQRWRPALAESKPVDCYQILSFTIDGGKLDRVSYR